MSGGTAKQRMHYWALLALTTLGKGYLSAKTWPDRGPRFNWIALLMMVSVLGVLTWWNPYAFGWLCGLGFCWIQIMGIDNDDENARLRKALKQVPTLGDYRGAFNRLDRWLLDGCLSPTGQQRLRAAALACTLPAPQTKGSHPRF